MFLRGDGVSHSNAVHLIVSLSKTDCPIYQEEELTSVYKMFLKLFPGHQNSSKIHNVNKIRAIQSFKRL